MLFCSISNYLYWLAGYQHNIILLYYTYYSTLLMYRAISKQLLQLLLRVTGLPSTEHADVTK